MMSVTGDTPYPLLSLHLPPLPQSTHTRGMPSSPPPPCYSHPSPMKTQRSIQCCASSLRSPWAPHSALLPMSPGSKQLRRNFQTPCIFWEEEHDGGCQVWSGLARPHCKVWVWACRWGKSGISQGRPVIPQPPLSPPTPTLLGSQAIPLPTARHWSMMWVVGRQRAKQRPALSTVVPARSVPPPQAIMLHLLTSGPAPHACR